MHFMTATWFIALVAVVLVGLGWTWGRLQRQKAPARIHSVDAMSSYGDSAMPATTDGRQANSGQAPHKHHGGCC